MGSDVDAGGNIKQKTVEGLHVADAYGFTLDLEKSFLRVDKPGSQIKLVVGARGEAAVVGNLVGQDVDFTVAPVNKVAPLEIAIKTPFEGRCAAVASIAALLGPSGAVRMGRA